MPGMITIVGNLGADAELRDINGQSVCNLRVGCRVGYGDRAVSTWWDVSVWGKPAQWCAELRKGDAVTVMGELSAREHNGTTCMGIRAQTVSQHERRDRAPQPQRQSRGGMPF